MGDFALFKMSKRTNLDIKDTACLHIVHNFQHPTSCPITKSTQTTMANAPKKNVLPLPAGTYGNSTKRSTQQRQQANQGKCGLEADQVRALGALHRLRSKKQLAAQKRRETHFFSNEEKEKWIEGYVERETAGAGKRVEDTEAQIRQEQEDTDTAENVGLTTTEPEKTFHEMMFAIGDSLSDITSSDDGDNGEDEDNAEIEQGQLSENDEPGWVTGTITKTVQQRMEMFRQKQMKLDGVTQSGWKDAAEYFHETVEKYGTSELRVPAVVKPQTDDDAAEHAPTTFGELMECLDIVPGISQMPQGTSRPGSSHMSLGS